MTKATKKTLRIRLSRELPPTGFEWQAKWGSGDMVWEMQVEGSSGSDGIYTFQQLENARVAYEFATTEWDGTGWLLLRLLLEKGDLGGLHRKA